MMPSFEESVFIDAPASAVWEHLTSAALMPVWMGDPEMAVEVETDWTVGTPVVIRGFHHLPFRNTGTVLAFDPGERLAYTHLSSLSRLPDEPASYTTFDFTLSAVADGTSLHLVASGFPTDAVFRHLRFYWGGALACLKRCVENGPCTTRE